MQTMLETDWRHSLLPIETFIALYNCWEKILSPSESACCWSVWIVLKHFNRFSHKRHLEGSVSLTDSDNLVIFRDPLWKHFHGELYEIFTPSWSVQMQDIVRFERRGFLDIDLNMNCCIRTCHLHKNWQLEGYFYLKSEFQETTIELWEVERQEWGQWQTLNCQVIQ